MHEPGVRMRRVGVWALSLALCIGLLTGCGKKGGEAGDDGEKERKPAVPLGLDFQTVKKIFDDESLDSAEKLKQFEEQCQGKSVEWTGVVTKVQASGIRVSHGGDVTKPEVLVKLSDMADAEGLKEMVDKVTYTGRLESYKDTLGFIVTDAKLVK